MKSLATACLVSLCLAAPALAHAGNGHGHGHGHGKHWNKHAEKHWKKEHKHWARHHRHFRDEAVVQHYYAPPPRVIGYAEPLPVYSPPPGVHIVLPNIYIPM